MNAKNYTLYPYSKAAIDIAEEYELSDAVRNKLDLEMAKAIKTNKLTVRDKSTNGPIKVDNHSNSQDIIWVTTSDINQWLQTNEYPYIWTPTSSNHNSTNTAIRGMPTPEMCSHFNGIYKDDWGRTFADPPKWLKQCRLFKGKQGKRSAQWDPVLFAIELNKRFEIPKKKLDAVFVNLTPYLKRWQNSLEYLNY
jgi:hypothetical protein